MNVYTVTLADSTTIARARKDAAIKVADASGQDYVITSPSGQVVADTDGRVAAAAGSFTHDAEGNERGNHPTPTEAPAPEATEEENTVTEQQEQAPAKEQKPEGYKKAGRPAKAAPEAPETKKGETAVVYDLGNAAFTKVMLEGAASQAAAAGLSTSTKGQALILSGGDAKTRNTVAKAIRSSWEQAYVQFNAWKKDQKATRREQVKTTEGRREMLAQEREFLATALAGDDVL